MKKMFVFLCKGIVVIFVFMVSFWFIYKYNTKFNLETKLNYLNKNWSTVLKFQNEKRDLLQALIKESPQDIEYLDSLKNNLLEHSINYKSKECDSVFVYNQYLSNKYTLPLLRFFLFDVKFKKQKSVIDLKNVLDSINIAVEKYDFSVKDYNEYYSTFPNFIVAKSYDFKRKNYFGIKLGMENKDPKLMKKERRRWQRKIEIENGL